MEQLASLLPPGVSLAQLLALPDAKKREALLLLEAKQRIRARRKLFTYYPDTGPLRRELYPKHMQLFAAGLQHNERLAMFANRTGKTEGVGGYESTLHLTGRYPLWWPGIVFPHAIEAWAAGKTNETTRDIIQKKLLGDVEFDGQKKRVSGTGLIPYEDIGDITWKSGVQDLIDTVKIRNQFGGWSILGLKAYQQGRGSFEGTEKHLIWLDEEPPLDVYGECFIRTMTVNGHIIITFTPLEGHSDVVRSFLPEGYVETKDTELDLGEEDHAAMH